MYIYLYIHRKYFPFNENFQVNHFPRIKYTLSLLAQTFLIHLQALRRANAHFPASLKGPKELGICTNKSHLHIFGAIPLAQLKVTPAPPKFNFAGFFCYSDLAYGDCFFFGEWKMGWRCFCWFQLWLKMIPIDCRTRRWFIHLWWW